MALLLPTIICWECLSGYMKSAAEPDAIKTYCDQSGDLLCPECHEPYSLKKVSDAGCPDRVFEGLNQLKSQCKADREVKEALEAQKTALTAEFERIQKMTDLDERAAYMLRREIIDDVLNLKCPRCSQVFQDFEGCFALHCGSKTCNAALCAWCLKDCGSDAHSHVLICPENQLNGGYYGTIQMFHAHHNMRKKRNVEEILARQNREVQRIARQIMAKDLEGL